jgi:hypothetical protein
MKRRIGRIVDCMPAVSKSTAILLACICALFSTCADAQAVGGPLYCKWVFVGPKWDWEMSSFAKPKEFDPVPVGIDHSSFLSKERAIKNLKTYFQTAKEAGSNLPSRLLHWDPSALSDAHQAQAPYLQCPDPFFYGGSI